MISKELLEILICPDTQTPLAAADNELVSRANRAIAAGWLKHRAGEALTKAIEGGLVRQDQTMLYPVVDGIPILLVDEAIPLDQLDTVDARR